MAVSNARREQWKLRWQKAREAGEDPLQAGFDALKKWEADPLAHSRLAYWLKLEIWSAEEGLLVLAGVEPGTVVTGTEHFNNSAGAGDEWTNAQPFAEHFGFSFAPDPHDLCESDFGGNVEEFDAYLERIEHRRDVLRPLRDLFIGLQHKLEHSPSALGEPTLPGSWRPLAFLSWAASIGFRPHWHDWADEQSLLPDQLDAMAAPFFDADSDSYPELLHIAVRAWEAAQRETSGTPKQRIERYLAERYPGMTGSTRSAIALVANWQKAGGRPKQPE